jgi:hypothetical protein
LIEAEEGRCCPVLVGCCIFKGAKTVFPCRPKADYGNTTGIIATKVFKLSPVGVAANPPPPTSPQPHDMHKSTLFGRQLLFPLSLHTSKK